MSLIVDTSYHLPFWSFFEALETQLSYERWLDKYKLFLHQLFTDQLQYDESECPAGLMRLCKALYLQDIRDEARFESLLKKAWATEKLFWENHFETIRRESLKSGSTETQSSRAEQPHSTDRNNLTSPDPPVTKTETIDEPQDVVDTGLDTEESQFYFIPPPVPDTDETKKATSDNTDIHRLQFNLQEEYLPIPRREMAKAWQFLRHHERGRFTDQINVPATVSRIARDMIFLEPEFIYGKQNREDTLIFFVDRLGSMAPFHELSRRLVHAAKYQAGHGKAHTFYFRNYPMGYVYEKPNLTVPKKTKEALSKSNRQITIAVIISDAGFARSFAHEARHAARLEAIMPFLAMLNNHCAHTIWLNPMPENRWHVPVADAIREKILKMAPLITPGMNPLQNTLRNVLRTKTSATANG